LALTVGAATASWRQARIDHPEFGAAYAKVFIEGLMRLRASEQM